ncbi:MAG: hypothetical protein PS018_11555 [bacterium]|nr:hypothetical protein [bacterium]
MPEFVLDRGTAESARHFESLDTFTQAYIEALFFTEAEHGTVTERESTSPRVRVWNPETDSSLPGDIDFSDLAPETLAHIIADCAAFQADATAAAYIDDLDAQAGHDFWLTRNGHGAGFWDGNWPEPGASYLDARSKASGGIDVYLGDDGKVYLS